MISTWEMQQEPDNSEPEPLTRDDILIAADKLEELGFPACEWMRAMVGEFGDIPASFIVRQTNPSDWSMDWRGAQYLVHRPIQHEITLELRYHNSATLVLHGVTIDRSELLPSTEAID
jgi:hypothetical protein